MNVRPLLLAAVAAALCAGEAPPLAGPELWLHVMHNLNNDEAAVDEVIRLLRPLQDAWDAIASKL